MFKEFVEGNDFPTQHSAQHYDNMGEFMMVMLKSYFSTGFYVINDSVFCVLKGFIQLPKEVCVSLFPHQEKVLLTHS